VSTVTNIDRLVSVLDSQTFTTLFPFPPGTQLDDPLARPDTRVVLPGVDYGYDGRGTRAAPLAPSEIKWQFIYRYDATYPNWSALHKGMERAFGHGRAITLLRIDGDGVVAIVDAQCVDLPRTATADDRFRGQFTLTFRKRGPWGSQYLGGLPLYDNGFLYDNGAIYDDLGTAQFTMTGQYNSFSVTNNGTKEDRECVLTFNGPLSGPVLYSLSFDVRGTPIPAGVANPNPMNVRITDTLGAGDQYTLTCGTHAVSSNKAGVVAYLNVLTPVGQRVLFEVGAGVNNLQLNQNSSTGGGGLGILFRDRWP